MDTVSIHEASIILGTPEFLIRDFVSYQFNGKKLKPSTKNSEEFLFTLSELEEFGQHLHASWPGTERKAPPDYIERYLIFEALGACALCRNQKPNYENAHIDGWAKSRSNHPHNILRLCLDCHTSHGKDVKLLRAVKEECLRRIQLIDLGLVYGCSKDISPGEAVYVLNGEVQRAVASDGKKLARGFVRTKIGTDRCTVQRDGVVVGIGNLIPGENYYLSPEPGKVVTVAGFEAKRKKDMMTCLQSVGFAESSTHLAVNFWTPVGLTGD